MPLIEQDAARINLALTTAEIAACFVRQDGSFVDTRTIQAMATDGIFGPQVNQTNRKEKRYQLTTVETVMARELGAVYKGLGC